MQAEAQAHLAQAKELLTAVLDGRLALSDFERRFLALNAESPASLDGPGATALDEVFWAIEHHVDDPALRDADEIDDEHLLSIVASSLESIPVTGR